MKSELSLMYSQKASTSGAEFNIYDLRDDDAPSIPVWYLNIFISLDTNTTLKCHTSRRS
jgi:hypothetical protein